ncbi:MAG: glucosamine-6-phosphate deaminase [Chitinophagaceae bacterium]
MNQINILEDKEHLGYEAGKLGAELIKDAIKWQGEAHITLATGMSQFDTLAYVVNDKDIDWSKVTMFHLDEYIGLPITHRASFRRYLTERFVNTVAPLRKVVLINGETDPDAECKRLGNELGRYQIDVAFVGIGENGHMAFNDPPADFTIGKAYHVVDLDTQCRQQQVNEGWFDSVEEVPLQAISMTVKQILKSKTIICSVPGGRKANAVAQSLSGIVTPMHPASILQVHPDCYYFLDAESAALLKNI